MIRRDYCHLPQVPSYFCLPPLVWSLSIWLLWRVSREVKWLEFNQCETRCHTQADRVWEPTFEWNGFAVEAEFQLFCLLLVHYWLRLKLVPRCTRRPEMTTSSNMVFYWNASHYWRSFSLWLLPLRNLLWGISMN